MKGMTHRMLLTAVAAFALLVTAPARADFNTAVKDYKAGNYPAARGEFAAMAELGDCSSQFNLGAMLVHGQGGPKDVGTGAGWLQTAASNGCEKLVAAQLTAVQGHLSAEEQRTAAALVARYGRDALHAQGIVDPDLECRGEVPPAAQQAPTPEYPPGDVQTRRSGIVIAELTIGTDGRARDPQILVAEPGPAFAASAVEAWLNTRFVPATRNGVPVQARVQARQLFSIATSAPPWDQGAYQGARQAADAGEPRAEYLVGLTATVDPSIGVDLAHGRELLMWAARDGYAPAQYWIATRLRAVSSCHGQPQGAAWLKHAADGGDAAAQMLRATDLLGGSPSAEAVSEARGLLERAAASSDYYVMKHVVALLAAGPVTGARDPATAQQVAARLAAGPIQSDPQMFEALAAASAANGNFAEAATREQAAVSRARELNWDTLAMQQRLAAYRAGRSWQGDVFADRG